MGATHLKVSLTPADALTHLLPGHAGVGAGVVRLLTKVHAVLIGVITSRPHRGVTGKGHRQLPTFITDMVCGAGVTGLEAAVLIRVVGPDAVSARSAVTPVILPDACIPAHLVPPSVSAGVGVGGAVTRPHSSQHQQWDY